MLLGIDCNAAAYKKTNYFQPTPEQRVQALNTLSRMAFVGLTEYWQETICLFHAMFGGRITPHEMDNVRYVGPHSSMSDRSNCAPSDSRCSLVCRLAFYTWCSCSLSILPSRPGVAASHPVGAPEDMPIWMKEIPIEEDPFDYEIFMVAKRIFATRLIKYGIRVPQDLL
jgi:hypothetical protein